MVLLEPSHPGNIGAAARAMKTMGFAKLVLVRPRQFPHPDAEARSSRATDVLAAARICATLEEALSGCTVTLGFTARRRELVGRVAPLREAARQALAGGPRAEIGLVFGNEMTGLSNEVLDALSTLVYIPANPDYSSLNLAAAVQVVAYEMRQAIEAGGPWQPPRFPPATHEAIAAFHAHAERTLVALRFLNPRHPRRLMPRLRRLFARTTLEHEEVNILRGVLAAIDRAIDRARRSGPG